METVEELLNKWGFPNLIETFAENEVDRESLQNMNMEFLKELVPKIGPRVKIWGKIKDFQLENQSVDVDLNISNMSFDIVNSSTQDINDGIWIEPEQCSSPSSTPSNASSNTSGIVPISNKNLKTTIKTDTETLYAVQYSQKATVGLPYTLAPAGVDTKSTVYSLINSTEEGTLIKASYGEGKQFLRNKLVALIIRNELKNNEKKCITSSRFVQLAKEIYDIFPHENPEVYYIPYINEKNNMPKAASGKLYHHYIQIRKNYKKLGILPNSRESSLMENVVQYKNDDYESEFVLWLRNNSEPFPKVQEYWLETHPIRQSMFKKMTIHDYFQAFPCLRLPLGYTLLMEDFNLIYPQNENKLFMQLSKFCKAILKVAEAKPNLYLKHTIEEYRKDSTLAAENLSDADQLFLLAIIPLLFSNVVPLKAKKKRWHPSKVEVKEGFIIAVKTAADVEVALSRRREKYEEYGLTIQPVPIWVGNYDKIESSYVSVNGDILYKVETPLKAIDVCFKLYFALDAEYPPEASLPWLLLQKAVYEILDKSNTGKERKYVSLSLILSELKQYM